jgi:predicted GTPase
VVTDSQAVLKVDGDLDIQVPLTTFSILFSRFKGNLELQAAGTRIISDLKPGDRVIIAEACTHHSLAEDIGRVKIPRWLNQYVGGALKIEVVSGHQLPKDISDCRLIIQCGACMWNRKEVTNRLEELQERNIAVTNYGLAIAYLQGVFERCIAPFGLSLNK